MSVNKNYLTNITAAISGRQGFVGSSPEEPKINNTVIIVIVVISLIFALGAARLSYTYNLYIGNSTGVAFGYAVLNSFFSYLYYPFYAFFLNPVGSRKPIQNNAARNRANANAYV
jgi:hypothetical protein